MCAASADEVPGGDWYCWFCAAERRKRYKHPKTQVGGQAALAGGLLLMWCGFIPLWVVSVFVAYCLQTLMFGLFMLAHQPVMLANKEC